MKKIFYVIISLVLLSACGQSYEETKRLNRQQRREAMRKDSAALKIAVMPTLDCLPMYVAEYEQLYDTLNGGVRLKPFKAHIDCDTAIMRQRVEGTVSDLVRALRMEKRGTSLRYVAVTNGSWQLITNRNSRIHQLKQLDDKMIAMTRFSVTDMLSDMIVDSVKLRDEHVFRVQINDLDVRMQMLQNNEMDALFFSEPQATMARMAKNPVVLDTRKMDLQMGVLVFREKEMRRPERHKQLDLFVKAYNAACDSINKKGVKYYRNLVMEKCHVSSAVVDSLPKNLKYQHAIGPRQQDIDKAQKWLNKK
ncbi:MAG: ABC transporter substrate-binding protein [Prevotella sp.]|nr:ABC transporter substrate-binding protein [Prevotella sp.]MBQ8153879.1 ABC transporter substrate-binding protein [Prevotella sp.]MBQ8715578.1 ABC transporter substrate-binding protein [Prevotella sp.]